MKAKKAVAALALVIGSFILTGSAQAASYKRVIVYEYVTCYKTRTVPYLKQELKYDHCGRPYYRKVIAYKQEVVPYKKAVAVEKLVKCD